MPLLDDDGTAESATVVKVTVSPPLVATARCRVMAEGSAEAISGSMFWADDCDGESSVSRMGAGGLAEPERFSPRAVALAEDVSGDELTRVRWLLLGGLLEDEEAPGNVDGGV